MCYFSACDIDLMYYIFHQAVDEHGIPGVDRVDSLAEYSVGLRTEHSATSRPVQL